MILWKVIDGDHIKSHKLPESWGAHLPFRWLTLITVGDIF